MFLEEKLAFVIFVLMAVFFICCLVSSIIMCTRGNESPKVSVYEMEAIRRKEEDEEAAIVAQPLIPMVQNNSSIQNNSS